jgi:hypothetical protein
LAIIDQNLVSTDDKFEILCGVFSVNAGVWAAFTISVVRSRLAWGALMKIHSP